MSKFPSAYDVYNLSENFMATIEDTFRGTGDDNSLTNSKIIHIGSAPTERMVAFTAFVESYKINLQKEIDEQRAASSTTTYFTDVDGNLSISLSLNIPAHSTNEAVNNVAKIEELQRLNILGEWDDDSVSELTQVTIPIMVVHFANLISNSRKVTGFQINSFTDLVQKGFPCYIESISYEPQADSGFFEFDNFLYPKNIKLNLELKYESIKLFGVDDPNLNKEVLSNFKINSTWAEIYNPAVTQEFEVIPAQPEFAQSQDVVIQSQFGLTFGTGPLEENPVFPEIYTIRRFYDSVPAVIGTTTTPASSARLDDGMWPFHSDGIKHYNKPWKKMSVSKMNDLGLENYGENKKYFLFISIGATNDASLNRMISGAKNNKDFLSGGLFLKYVMFETAVTSFSRNLNSAAIVADSSQATPSSTIHSDLKSLTFKTLDYSINIDVVSSSLAEAYQNCAKIQYLTRIFLKKSRTDADEDENSISELQNASEVRVYAPSFIESGKGGKAIATDLETICKTKSIKLNFVDLQVEVDMSSGFYEDRGRMFPKKMTLSMVFKTGTPEYMVGYNINIGRKGNKTWTMATPSDNPADVYDIAEPFLFPYNRKTVKIGGE